MVGFFFGLFLAPSSCIVLLHWPPPLVVVVVGVVLCRAGSSLIWSLFIVISFGADIFFRFLDFSLEFSDLFVVVALELLVSSFVVVKLLSQLVNKKQSSCGFWVWYSWYSFVLWVCFFCFVLFCFPSVWVLSSFWHCLALEASACSNKVFFLGALLLWWLEIRQITAAASSSNGDTE